MQQLLDLLAQMSQEDLKALARMVGERVAELQKAEAAKWAAAASEVREALAGIMPARARLVVVTDERGEITTLTVGPATATTAPRQATGGEGRGRARRVLLDGKEFPSLQQALRSAGFPVDRKIGVPGGLAWLRKRGHQVELI